MLKLYLVTLQVFHTGLNPVRTIKKIDTESQIDYNAFAVED